MPDQVQARSDAPGYHEREGARLVSLAVVTLSGNLGGDAELRYAQSGNAVLRFTLACSSTQGAGEQRQEHTDWYAVSMFGKRGEAIAQYLLKGTRVVVVG